MTETTDLSRMIDGARLLREHYLRDPHRPGYHFVVPEGTHSPVDPNGAIFYGGRYHLCYIYQHEGAHYWGHISSLDLVHWRHHPPALAPGEGDDGIFSGGAFVDDDGTVVYTYWGLRKPDGICLATSTDPLLEHWTRNPNNPVITATEFGWTERDGQPVGAADPSQIWKKDGRYYMLTGNLLVLKEFGEKRGLNEHKGDTLFLFVSDDLTNWQFLHTFYTSKREWTRDFEDDMCPDFFMLPGAPDGDPATDTAMILFISHTLGCQYYLGTYADDRFTPEQHGRMTWVDNEYFAPESLADPRGRRIMWAWVFDRRSQETKAATGWSGELSLPRLLWRGDDGTLRLRPVPELEALRYQPRAVTLDVAGTPAVVPGVAGTSLELAVTLPGDARGGVQVCRAPDGSEVTTITFDPAAGTLSIDTTQSSLGEGAKAVETAPLTLPAGEPLQLRVFVDKSIVEVYANDRQAVVRRIYPTRADSTGVAVFCDAPGAATVQAWEMMPSNPY
jgi:beta-fructofuranosidase